MCRNKIHFIIILLLFLFNMYAQKDLITNVANRNIKSLNGKWNIIIDPYNNGFYDYRMEENSNGFFKNQKPSNKSDLVEYDFDKSETLIVPGDWNSQKPELLYYEGSIWYKTSFNYKLPAGKRLFLWFGAINYKADVYLNGTKIGHHEGGFTPFYFDITSLIKEKDNFLIVRVNNERKPEYVPTINTDWWNYGGITRDVLLIEEDSLFVLDYFIFLNKNDKNNISGWIKLNKPLKEKEITIKIPELKILYKSKTDSSGIAYISIKSKDIILWSPTNPKLYSVEINFQNTNLKDKIGFKNIEIKGKDIIINGEKVFLKGICIHEELPMRRGRANGIEDAKTLLGWAKELGCNYVRLAHYPHNEWMTRMADSMGLFVWSEIPVYWTIQFKNPNVYTLSERMLEDNINRDKNRVSILVWSIGNETPVYEERTEFMRKLARKAKELDPTRFVSAALEISRDNENPFIYNINDPLGEYLDIISCNEYVGWYDGLPEKTEKITWKCKYDKPFLFSELGAGALQGYHGDSLTRWTEEYQEYFYTQQIKMLRKINFLSGLSPWILADFRSPRRQLSGIQDGWNRKGLISSDGQKKKAFYVLKEWYKEIK